ncbi:MAG TPA: hypothetical protein VNR66_01910 [Solirubrobacteraceae bacterium]|nr:hypothetical protein [Solirubrobacteraceae bacterium]
MSLTRLIRTPGNRRRTRTVSLAPVAHSSPEEPRRRHPAMAGINCSPVHGRHCICGQCRRQAA